MQPTHNGTEKRVILFMQKYFQIVPAGDRVPVRLRGSDIPYLTPASFSARNSTAAIGNAGTGFWNGSRCEATTAAGSRRIRAAAGIFGAAAVHVHLIPLRWRRPTSDRAGGRCACRSRRPFAV